MSSRRSSHPAGRILAVLLLVAGSIGLGFLLGMARPRPVAPVPGPLRPTSGTATAARPPDPDR